MAVPLREKLKKQRLELGYSLDELAKLSGSSKSYLWELENRDTRKPSAEKLSKIAKVLNVTTEYLLDENADLNDKFVKEAFFRKFNRLDAGDKQRIQDMIDAWAKPK
ncbi:MAG: transcriptional regulator [Sphingomonadales bacterium CG12_big_fil_rev_8_21_14_0_65_65_10]|nr:MAG: transcriptional regulator [Sphingomonadales bacterium CG12_big_fil_rev_8_21_14_0_65_65_10]